MIKIIDIKKDKYYIHRKTGIVIYITSNLPLGTSQHTLIFSYYDKKVWQPERAETHPSIQELDVSEIDRTGLGAIPKHFKDSTGVKPGEIKITIKSIKKVPAKPKHPARAAIIENKHSLTCVKCKQPTKELALFNSVTRWCPACE